METLLPTCWRVEIYGKIWGSDEVLTRCVTVLVVAKEDEHAPLLAYWEAIGFLNMRIAADFWPPTPPIKVDRPERPHDGLSPKRSFAVWNEKMNEQ